MVPIDRQPTKELPALDGLSYHPPSLSFIIAAPLQRLRPGRFAFIPTERVCHLSRPQQADMKTGTDSSLMRKWTLNP
jgi:hypothetical protein